MNNREALGYFLLACREKGISKEVTSNLYDTMQDMMDMYVKSEAESVGHNWYSRLED